MARLSQPMHRLLRLPRSIVRVVTAYALVAAVTPAPLHAADATGLFRWIDRAGQVHYSDRLPPGDARNVQQKRLPASVAASTLPYDLREAMRQHPVTLYTFACGESCVQGRALLVLRGTPFTEKDANDAAVQDEMRQIAGSTASPLLVVGKLPLQGWEPSAWNNALDAAGYPRTPRTAQATAEASKLRRSQPGLVEETSPPAVETRPAPAQPVLVPVAPAEADNLQPRYY